MSVAEEARRSDILVESTPEAVAMSPIFLLKVEELILNAIIDKAAPGMAAAVGRRGKIVLQKGYGKLDWAADSDSVTVDTLYDLASLTKVIGSTTAAMILEEEGKLDLHRTVASYLPEFDNPEKKGITVFQLFVHKGGMEPFAALYESFRGKEQYLEQINHRPLKNKPGTVTEYSDWDLILAQFIMERITGTTLDVFLNERVFKPLGMKETVYNPGDGLKGRCAPTEVKDFRGGLIRGVVHDENAWAMGGMIPTRHDASPNLRIRLFNTNPNPNPKHNP
jgi:CubicO group peptidase (beta-lactamase class C family)